MKTRLMVAQAYLVVFGCGLLMLGLFAGADFLLSDESFLFGALILTDHLLLAVLAGGLPGSCVRIVDAAFFCVFRCSYSS